MPANNLNNPLHILVIRLSAMGDVAMTVPVLRALVDQHPTLKVTVVSRPFFQPFFEGIINVNFFAVDVKKRHRGFWGLIRLFFDLKKLNVDAVADLHNVLRSQIIRKLFALSGKKVAFTDKGRAEKKTLTQPKNKIFQPLKTMVERHLETFQKLGFSVNLSVPVFPKKEFLSDKIKNITAEKSGVWLGIAPFAQYETKMYPLDLMQQVIQKLSESGVRIFLFGGGKQEQETLDKMAAQTTSCINITGKLSLKEEMILIGNLNAMLSMDSGNGHIAAILGVPVVTLWGNTHPYAGFVPFNQPLKNSITPSLDQFPLLPTSVYGNKKIEGYIDCMKTIPPQKVVDKVLEVLNTIQK